MEQSGAEWSRGRGGVVRAVSDLGPPELSRAERGVRSRLVLVCEVMMVW